MALTVCAFVANCYRRDYGDQERSVIDSGCRVRIVKPNDNSDCTLCSEKKHPLTFSFVSP